MGIKRAIASRLPVPLLLFMKKLIKYRVYSRSHLSQAGQDAWVINEVFGRKKNGFFVDIGATDGIDINNTYMLEKRHGWTGICIEPDPEFFRALRRNRSCICVNACL